MAVVCKTLEMRSPVSRPIETFKCLSFGCQCAPEVGLLVEQIAKESAEVLCRHWNTAGPIELWMDLASSSNDLIVGPLFSWASVCFYGRMKRKNNK